MYHQIVVLYNDSCTRSNRIVCYTPAADADVDAAAQFIPVTYCTCVEEYFLIQRSAVTKAVFLRILLLFLAYTTSWSGTLTIDVCVA